MHTNCKCGSTVPLSCHSSCDRLKCCSTVAAISCATLPPQLMANNRKLRKCDCSQEVRLLTQPATLEGLVDVLAPIVGALKSGLMLLCLCVSVCVSRYAQVLRENPRCPAEVRLGIAACLYRSGKLQKASAAYNRQVCLSVCLICWARWALGVDCLVQHPASIPDVLEVDRQVTRGCRALKLAEVWTNVLCRLKLCCGTPCCAALCYVCPAGCCSWSLAVLMPCWVWP